MANVPEKMLYEGVAVDIGFGNRRPSFGDLYLICGHEHPKFQPTAAFGFGDAADLQFSQVDDYFGVCSLGGDGDDVVIWLYPLIGDEPVFHDEGPFDGIRLAYNVLRNPSRHAEHYLRSIERLSTFGTSIRYASRGIALSSPPDVSRIRADIKAIEEHWASEGVEVGSDSALEIDY